MAANVLSALQAAADAARARIAEIETVGVGETVRFSEICRRAGEPRQDIVGVALRRAVSKGWFEKLGTGLYRRVSQPALRANHKTPSQEGDEVR